MDGASAASESGAENSSSIHAEGPLIRGLGHAAASLKVGTVAAIVALLTVPDEYQPMLRLAVQAALGLVMLLWQYSEPADQLSLSPINMIASATFSALVRTHARHRLGCHRAHAAASHAPRTACPRARRAHGGLARSTR